MQLTTEDGTIVDDPTSEQLLATLARLGLPGNGYAILAAAEQEYLQVAGSRADGYIAEYREGSEETHHHSRDTNLSHQQMSELMVQYLGGDSWKRSIPWAEGFDPGPVSSGSRGRELRFLWIFMLVGIASLAAGAYQAYTTHGFLERAVEVPGKVVRMIETKGRRGRSLYAPFVEYTDREGRARTLQSNQSSNPPAFFEGEAVTVVYDPADPRYPLTAKIRSFGELWGLSMFLLLFGLGFIGVPLAILALSGWFRHR